MKNFKITVDKEMVTQLQKLHSSSLTKRDFGTRFTASYDRAIASLTWQGRAGFVTGEINSALHQAYLASRCGNVEERKEAKSIFDKLMDEMFTAVDNKAWKILKKAQDAAQEREEAVVKESRKEAKVALAYLRKQALDLGRIGFLP